MGRNILLVFGKQTVARWSCPHAAVSSQGVVAWLAAELEVPLAELRLPPTQPENFVLLQDQVLRALVGWNSPYRLNSPRSSSRGVSLREHKHLEPD